MTKSRFFRGLGHFPAGTSRYPQPPTAPGAVGLGALGARGLLTGVISHISVDGEAPDVVGLDHVGVPFLAVAGVVQHVIEGLGGDILAGDAGLWGQGAALQCVPF